MFFILLEIVYDLILANIRAFVNRVSLLYCSSYNYYTFSYERWATYTKEFSFIFSNWERWEKQVAAFIC